MTTAQVPTVSEILELRRGSEGGVSKTVTGSVIVHVLGVITLFLAHQYVVAHPKPKPIVMTISLGSGNGPKSTGMNTAGARQVDVATPEPKRPEVVKPAGATSNTMTLPVKSTPKPAKVEETLQVTSTPKPASTGREVTRGTSLAETGSKTQETGLSVGGKGVQVEGVADLSTFCCNDYLNTIMDRIRLVWNQNVGQKGFAILKFTVNRDGSISDISVDQSTGTLFENQSRAALMLARIPPWPPELKNNTLVIHLRFPYGME